VTSDVTAACLSQPSTSGKALAADWQQYAPTNDVRINCKYDARSDDVGKVVDRQQYARTDGVRRPVDRQQYAPTGDVRPIPRTDDVSDLMLGAGNDYFHHHRRHQFRQVSPGAAYRQPDSAHLAASARTNPVTGLDFSPGTGRRSDPAEHIYESPNHDKMARSYSSSIHGQLADEYCSEHDFRVVAS